MSAAWVIEAVDVLEDGSFGLPAGFAGPAPDQFDRDGLEEDEEDRKTAALP